LFHEIGCRKNGSHFFTVHTSGSVLLKKIGGHIVLLFTGIIIALLFAEIITRAIMNQNRMVTWIEMHPDGFMMNASNLNALHHWRDRNNRYRLNNLGFRGDDITQKNDEYRILLIGDSFTFGLYLKEEHTISSHLSRFASDDLPHKTITFLNGGTGGAGMADWPGWLETTGRHAYPDMVLYFLNTGDTDRALSKNLWVLDETGSALVKSQRWKPRNLFILLGRQPWYRWLQEKSRVMNLVVRLAWQHLYFKDLTYNFNPEKSRVLIPDTEHFNPENDYSKFLSYKIIEKMQEWCTINQCNLLVTTTGFFEKNHTEPHTWLFYNSLLHENVPFPYVDNTECILEKGGDSIDLIIIPGTDHPDERGSQYIAECSWKWLRPYLNENLTQQ
jgi:hypothetical protein